MVDKINVEELIKVAGNIEKDGQDFYREAAEYATDPEDKKLFTELAGWEEKHYKIFNALLKDVFSAEFDQVLDVMGEAALYLQAVLGGDIFSGRHSARQIAEDNEQGIIGIFNFAIEREKDSIIFYTALEKVIDASLARSELDKIVGEEISHVRFLTNMRKKYI